MTTHKRFILTLVLLLAANATQALANTSDRIQAIEFTNEKGSSTNLSANAKTAKPVAGNKTATLHGKRMPDGDGSVAFSGELKQWHNVILTLDGPFAHELDTQPNPFIDRQMNVIFTHESGQPNYRVPAYFAADGNAAESSAESGIKWRAHLSPDKTGTWNYRIDFKGTEYDGTSGSFVVGPSDKSGRDLRAKGRLQYVGERYLQFADSGEWFIKFGADAPETFLAYKDFDNTIANNPKKSKLKSWKPHLEDWAPGDPTWKDGKGKGMIGAVNYLASTGANVFSFLTYNAGGDGDNIWPHVSRSDKLHFDCSKLDQWGIVFSHATAKGMYLHFKLQETENDDLRGKSKAGKEQALDQGKLGIERKAYLREMIARYGHNLALNWNIGEENTQTHEEIVDQAHYIRELDPYQHLLVLHTYPNQQQKVYGSLLGQADLLTGLSIQNSNVAHCHANVLNWVSQSKESGHNWVVAIDEPGNASTGTPPDPDYPGMQKVFDKLNSKKTTMHVPTLDEIRSQVIWGSLMGGGAGVEFYFGYQLPQNDLNAEDWRSRAQTWEYSRIAMDFFQNGDIPFTEMSNANALVGNSKNSNERYCFAKPNELYLVYLSKATAVQLDLSEAEGDYSVQWFNPRTGGTLKAGTVKTVQAGSKVDLGTAPINPEADWLLVVRRK